MRIIRTLIIDDEPHCVTALLHDLEMFCPEVKVLATCHSGKEGIQAIRKHQPDLVFLDIEMPNMNGFEMLESLKTGRNFEVIFTTAYDDFTLKAIRVNALDYLLKPIDGAELAEAVNRAKGFREQQIDPEERIDKLLHQVYMPEGQRLALPNRNGYEFVSPMDICYCKADGAYTLVVLTDGREILLSKALGETEHMLPARFFERIHHSTIVNIREVRQFNKNSGYMVVMTNGDSLNVARSKKDQLLLRMGIK